MFRTLKKLFYLFDQRTVLQFLSLFVLAFLGSILEVGGIGLIMPFIKVIEDPGIIESNALLCKINKVVGAENPTDFLIYMSIGLMTFYVIKNIYLGVMNYLQARFVFSKRSSLGRKLFSLYLNSSLIFHLERNTAELDRNIRFEIVNVYVFVKSLLILCTELCVLIMIVVMLLLINPIVAISSAIVFGVVSGGFYKSISTYARRWGEMIQSSQKHIGQAIFEGLGAIKEVKISGRESFFPNRFYSKMMENAHANWMQSTLTSMPRYFLEVIAIGIIILIIILSQIQHGQIKTVLPTLGLFAMATMRIMPSLSKIVSCLQQIRFTSPAVDVIYKDIQHLKTINHITPWSNHSSAKTLSFKREINVQNLSYSYPNSDRKALQRVSFKILKGQSVALVGPSGAGKTTLANLILGLLVPSEGKICVDEQDVFQGLAEWQRNIGYIPQSIYLLDANIRNNVAFGLEDEAIDDFRVWEALKIAQLELFVKQLPNQLNTFAGENGIRLSGGQRQRLGIARALYDRPKVLIFDEATSALDNETEKEVSGAISELSGEKTLIIIAHRLSTIRHCDCLHFMVKGAIADSGTFDELLSKNPEFRQMAYAGDLSINGQDGRSLDEEIVEMK